MPASPPTPIPGRSFICPDCQSPFSRKEYVERHRRLKHLNSRPFTCTECSHAFARSDLLKRHRKTCPAVLALEQTGAAPSKRSKRDATELAPIDISLPGSGSAGDTPVSFIPSDFVLFPSPPSLALPALSSGSSTSAGSSLASTSSDTTPNSSSSASPPGSYGSDFRLFQNGNADPTLAPAIGDSGFGGAGRYTLDDIAASQVLEDLLPREPSGSVGAQWGLPSDNLALSPYTSQSVSYPYSSAPSQSIETSPEAQALAEYFNRGGVGGITALDLGFKYEPSLLPDHVFEPQYTHSVEHPKFLLPKNKFYKTYLGPWYMPPLETLSSYAAKATRTFLPTIPVVHPATLQLSTIETHTAFALTVIGGAYDPVGEKFSNELLVEKRVHLVRFAAKPETTDEEHFAYLQSMLLYQLLGLFHRHAHQRRLSHSFHGALVMMMRQGAVVKRIKQAQVSFIHADLAGDELERVWQEWVKVETMRRVAFIIYLCDLETATTLDTPPLMSFTELSVDLPACDKLWNAKDATEWLEVYTSRSTAKPLPFLEALQALLRTSPPEPYSSDAIVLAELKRLSSFPLLVITRTLSFLEHQAMNETGSDPLRLDLLAEGAKRSESLERIKSGRALLRALPGGLRRGGGEGWWQDVMPKAADFPENDAAEEVERLHFIDEKPDLNGLTFDSGCRPSCPRY